MIAAFVVLLFLCDYGAAARTPTDSPSTENTCIACHSQLGGELTAPVTAMKGDVHNQHGLSCANCHGGDPTRQDPERAMDPRKGFVGEPAPKEIPHFCGKCHSNPVFMKRFTPSPRVDQVTEYYTSIHGKRLRRGDQRVATCISCHGYHGVKAVADSSSPVYPTHVAETCGKCHANAVYMRPYSIPTDQLERWGRSVHATALLKKQDLSAPTCNDCHGSHGAVPPGVNSVANVCGTCHVRQAGFFEKSPHGPAFKSLQLAGCVVCHGNHEILAPTDSMLGVGKGAVCLHCHVKGDAGYQGAKKMGSLIDELAGHIRGAKQLLDEAASAGMEVSRSQFELKKAQTALINGRVVIHSFSPAKLQSAIAPGLKVAAQAHQAGVKALHGFHIRRVGLAASLIFIFLAVAAVYLKLRVMERRKP